MSNTFGCGNYTCLDCYPFQYSCDWCGSAFEDPVPNGENYVCLECDFDSNLLEVDNAYI